MSLTGVREVDEGIIFGNNHPYYINYCYTSQGNLSLCNEYVYQLYRKWCEPGKSLEEIQEILPNLTFPDLVELSLVYYPIPESIGKYDSLTLFYYACESGQNNPTLYLDGKANIPASKLISICLAFNRTELLPQLRDLNYISNELLNEYVRTPNIANTTRFNDIDVFFDNSLFDIQVLMEHILNIRSWYNGLHVYHMDRLNDIVKGIAGIYNNTVGSLLAIKYINKHLDIGIIQEALDYYLPNSYVASQYYGEIPETPRKDENNYLCNYVDSKEITFGYLAFYQDELSPYDEFPEDLGR